MTTRPFSERALGVALLALLAYHAATRPEGGWLLLSGCDLAAIATAIGLVAGWHRPVATAFLFQLTVGLPALILGLLTTYEPNITGIAVHVVPLAIGGVLVARHGMPRNAAYAAWFVCAASMMAAAAFAPPALNINFATVVWPPLADTFSLKMFQTLLIAAVGLVLWLGELGLRRLVPGAPPTPSRRPPAPSRR